MNCDSNSETDRFLNILFEHSALPTITKPTRFTNHSSTLIDNIISNCIINKYQSSIVLSDISDHLPIIFTIELQLERKKKDIIVQYSRNINISTLKKFTDNLQNLDWGNLDILDADNAYNSFADTFTQAYNNSLPIIPKKINFFCGKYKPWITCSIQRSIRKKQNLYKKSLKSQLANDLEKYKKYKNKLTSVIRSAEKIYYENKFKATEGNMRQTWKIINTMLQDVTGSNSTSNNFKIINNQTEPLTDSFTTANYFNDFFSNIGPNLAQKFPDDNNPFSVYNTMPNPNPKSFFIEPCTSSEIINIAHTLNNCKGKGLDDVSVKVIKYVINYIAGPLEKVFNKSFENGVFPSELKYSKITPVFKADDKSLVNNYRPISLLSQFSKILEKLMYSRILKFLNSHHLLHDHQYGFRDNYSTSLAIVHLIDQITQNMDNNVFSVGVFLDLSKAFDTINHKILCNKLEIYGIRGVALNWFSSYLNNRQQCVSINNILSNFKTTLCGVPQGSVLGPLLFLIYVNDIINTSSLFKFIMFADDTNLFYSHSDLEYLFSVVNNELKTVSLWLKLNKLSLNLSKTHFILFRPRQKKVSHSLKITIEGKSINQVSSTKFLGVIIDENLSWAAHINMLHQKISKNFGIIRRLRYKLPSSILLLLYNTLIRPYYEYCAIIWATSSTVYLNKLQRLQKKIIRVIHNKKWNEHTPPLLKLSSLLNVIDQNKLQTACFVYRALYRLLPEQFQNYFTFNYSVHDHYTKRAADIHIDQTHTKIRQCSIKYHGAILWNSLPVELKDTKNIFLFKKRYKLLLFSSYK